MKHTFAAALIVIVAVFVGSEARAEFDLRFGLGAGHVMPSEIESGGRIELNGGPVMTMVEISPGYRFNRSFGIYADLYYARIFSPINAYGNGETPPASGDEVALFVTPRVYANIRFITLYAGLGVGVSYRYDRRIEMKPKEGGGLHEHKFHTVAGDHILAWLSIKPEAGIDFQISRRFTLGLAFQALIGGWKRVYRHGEKVEVMHIHFYRNVKGRYTVGHGVEAIPLMPMIRMSYR